MQGRHGARSEVDQGLNLIGSLGVRFGLTLGPFVMAR